MPPNRRDHKVGVFPVKQRLSDEVASKVVALGVRSFLAPIISQVMMMVVIDPRKCILLYSWYSYLN